MAAHPAPLRLGF